MNKTLSRHLTIVLLISGTGSALAQSLPTAQPNLITIVREEVKVGRAEEHAKIEAGWPAAYEKAKSPDYYLALVSLTGPPEAWYVTPYASHAVIGEGFKRDDADPVLSAELARLSRADAEVLNGVRTMQARARTELSYGAYPDLGRQRFFEVSWFRLRPGHGPQFETAAKAYGAALKRAASTSAFRVYEIIAGTPGPTYLIFSSVAAYAEFDGKMAHGDMRMKGATPDEGAALNKLMLEGVLNIETQRFRLDPGQSYVPADTRAQDPAFWLPKKPAPSGQP